MFELKNLIGEWRGEGHGRFPTIEAFGFAETWHVTSNGNPELVHYQQRTTLIPDGRPSHWESGFLLAGEKGEIQWTFADNSGRLGAFRQTESCQSKPGTWELGFQTTQIHNDDRVLGLTRQMTLCGDHLHYTVAMETTTTVKKEPHLHLSIDLYRIA